MADEIDIEEHDIMENPVIKNKFPDLSVLKKEMCNYYDELETTPGLKQRVTLSTDMNPKLVEVRSNFKPNCKKISNTSNSYATPTENSHLQSNKIILGSKPNKVSVDQTYFDKWAPYEANIVLQDIQSYLSKSRRYCETCSILFPEPKEYEAHLQTFHTHNSTPNTANTTIDKKREVSEEHRCNICSNTFATKYVLKRHVDNIHNKEKEGSAKNTNATKFIEMNHAIDVNEKKNISTDLSNTCFHCKKSFDTQKALIEHLYDILQTKKKTTEIVPVLKSILFKCNKCDINFVSSQVAASHNDHMEMLINWKCSICSRIFKKEDELSHERQHSVSNNFVLYNLGEIDVDKILFKCSKCSTHFTENKILYHFRDCSLKKCKSVHCKICDIFLDGDLITSHNSNHKHTGLNLNQFTVIETEVISDNPVKNVNKAKQFKNDASDLLKTFSEVKIVLKRLEEDELLTHEKSNKDQIAVSHSLISAKATKKRRLSPNAQNKIAGKWARTRLVMKTMTKDRNVSKTDRRKVEITSNIRKRKSLVRIDVNHPLRKVHKLAYSYCEYCKSFITRFRTATHMQSRCLKLKNRVCIYCGLTFTPTSYLTHTKLHEKNKNLKLKNFKFYNLHNGLPMSPPIPEYPICMACGVHFLTIATRENHICSEEAYLTCHTCEMKLSEAAFKLHMMFHHYTGDVNTTTSSKYIETDINLNCGSNTSNIVTATVNNLNIQSSEMYENDDRTLQKSGSDLGEIIYTCRNCRITVDTYDKVIEHCQGHCNVDGNGMETNLCNICKLDIDKESYEKHHKIHEQGRNINVLKFDSYYFPEENYLWVNHIFKSIPSYKITEILSKSIYRYEGRIKMDIIQQGAPNLTVYKCDRCSCFIEPTSVFKHADNSCFKLRKHPCAFCGLPYNSSASRADHEEIHRNPGITPNSYRIVLFNREQDKELNRSFCYRKKYVLYQCRDCNGLINKLDSDVHECDTTSLKKCLDCDLLIYNKDYEVHVKTHREFDSFNYKNMKVILLGSVAKGVPRGLRSNFKGNILDYRMYRCNKCQLCVKNEKFIPKHSCYYGRPQSKCPKCSLYFSVSRLKTHMRWHERDPDYVRSNMTMISFDPSNWDQNENATITAESGDCELTDSNSDSDCDFVMNEERSRNVYEHYEQSACEKIEVVEEIAKIYKCVCGLHFLNEDSISRHFGVCKSSIRTSKQECSKCNLLFTSNVLFTHMLAHHSSKNRRYKYEIIERYDVPKIS